MMKRPDSMQEDNKVRLVCCTRVIHAHVLVYPPKALGNHGGYFLERL